MSLRFPAKMAAIDIVDDPAGEHFTELGHEWRVLRVRSSDVEDDASFRQVVRTLARMPDKRLATSRGPHGRQRTLRVDAPSDASA